MIGLESKASSTTRHIARMLIPVTPGQQLPTTQELAMELDVGFGTVEKAIATLRANQVIQTRARGQMGTFLEGRNLSQLWEISGLGTMIGLLPLPNAVTFMGLATGTTEWFERIGIPYSLNFKNGAQARLQALLERRADFVVLSKRSADIVVAEHPETASVAELPEWSYYRGHDIVFRKNSPKPRAEWTIGVDSTSYDHVALCDEVFPECQRKEVHYVNLPYAIARGEIDATLLHTRSLVPMDLAQVLEVEPLSSSDLVLRTASAAVFLCHRDSTALFSVFANFGDTELIKSVQDSVIDGTRVPEY